VAAFALTACGRDEPAPEFGEAPAAAAPAPDPAAAVDVSFVGQTAGAMLGLQSRTASDVPVTAPPGPPADPAVQAICDRTAIFQVTAVGMADDPTAADLAELDQSMNQLFQDGSLLYGAITADDAARLTRCLDLAVDAVP